MAGSNDALGPPVTPVTPRHFCVAGACRHPLSFCVAGVALLTHGCRFAWQAWHFWHMPGSGGALGSRWSPVTPVRPRHCCVAGVALGNVDVFFA